MLEYLESLLTGTGHDLDLRTLKLVDSFRRTLGFARISRRKWPASMRTC